MSLARVRVCGVVERGEHVLVTEYRQRWIRSRRHQQQQPHLQQQQQQFNSGVISATEARALNNYKAVPHPTAVVAITKASPPAVTSAHRHLQ